MTGRADQASFDVVVPTIGRPSLRAMLAALAAATGPIPEEVIVVDDRRHPDRPLDVPDHGGLGGRLRVVQGPGVGPAAARNAGWRAGSAAWVAFLDDDVVPGPRWFADLGSDLAGLGPNVAGSQARIRVPLPTDRRPNDWERNVAGLESAHWATADMAYRRRALEQVGGFDERFRRAYREDVDLALRVMDAGWELAVGDRSITHPVRPADRWISVRLQAGNADDALMRARHGRSWRTRGGVPRGRRSLHVVTTAAALSVFAGVGLRRPRVAAVGAAVWLLNTARFATERIIPGPRTAQEVLTMVATSVAIPPVATLHWISGLVRARRSEPRLPDGWGRPAAVLFDRDGTLVHDVPYNGDPAAVRPVAGARAALDRLRAAGIPIAVVSNQSGIGRGLISVDEVDAVNRRIDELLGPFDAWLVCPHAPDTGCNCRKPSPGMVIMAAEKLGVPATACALVGDIGADVDAALAAGARPVLVPNDVTRREEITAAPEVARSLAAAVDLLLAGQTVSAGADAGLRRSA